MKRFYRYIALLLCAAMVCATPVCAAADDWAGTGRFVRSQLRTPSAGNTYGDWEIFAAARAGLTVPEGYYAAWLTMVDRVLAQNGGRLSGPVTGNMRLALALLALDQDLTDVGGYDLLALATDTQWVCRTTVMGPAFGILILKNCGGDPAAEKVYLQHLLDKQLADGGWALSGQIADPDATAMTLQALSLCRREAGVQAAIDRGLARLSAMQEPTGGFTAWGTTGCESVAQTVIALTMLDIPLTDSRFVKNGNSLLDALLSYRLADGSFSHTPGGAYDIMATQQALLALDALRREEAGLPGIYDLSDRVTVDRTFVGLPARDKRVSVPEQTVNIPTFTDISGLKEADAILELARRGVLNGVGDGRFDPSGRFTRAQFCAMAQRALTLPAAAGRLFSDVPAGA
ncbi:MAG: S-layer homology domain-containing protein, partial [Clostridia bacterium]|nr:S-layer homology domain-containing protein [Clostridia bacterium]